MRKNELLVDFPPKPLSYQGQHPIESSVERAQMQFQTMVNSQSVSLEEALVAYKYRYGRDPPPAFDKWFEMAQKNEYVLVDEFNTIMESLEPFWTIKPSLIRSRIQSAQETTFGLVRFSINDRRLMADVTHRGNYHANIIDRWLEKPGWLDILPDMTFLVNEADEARGKFNIRNSDPSS